MSRLYIDIYTSSTAISFCIATRNSGAAVCSKGPFEMHAGSGNTCGDAGTNIGQAGCVGAPLAPIECEWILITFFLLPIK